MTKLTFALSPIQKKVGDIRLEVVTAKTTETGLQADIEVWNGKLLFQDCVVLNRASSREKFIKQIVKRVPGADGGQLEDALLGLAGDLRKRFEREEEKPQEEITCPPSSYIEEGGNLLWLKPTTDKTIKVPLANYTAKIVIDHVKDNGVTQDRLFEIDAECKGVSHNFTLPADEFRAMNWPTTYMGGTAITKPSSGYREHVRCAVQELSTDMKTQQIFAHCGWRQDAKGEWRFLHAGGGVGVNGNDNSVRVDLGAEGLANYSLPDVPEGQDMRTAILASLSLLDVAPKDITTPLLAATYRAPLAEALPVELSVFLEGQSGSQKTELTAMAQAHFGAGFDRTHLPDAWTSTGNALEKRACLAKDAIFTVDDFKPSATPADAELYEKADRLLRGQANQQGRGRMNEKIELQKTYWPRGLVLCSGEDVPKGQSLRARTVIIAVKRGDVDLDGLTVAQSNAKSGLFAAAMASYLRWLAPRLDELKQTLEPKQIQLRDRANAESTFPHDRTPDAVASLAIGLDMLLDFAVEAGAISPEERVTLSAEGWKTLVKVGEAQAGEQSSEDDVERFMELLAEAFSCGRAHVADAKSGGALADAERWGWQNGHPRGECIGWVDGDDLLLAPVSAAKVVRKLAQDEGESLTAPNKTLWKRMAQTGLLASTESGRNAVRCRIMGQQKRLLHLKAASVPL